MKLVKSPILIGLVCFGLGVGAVLILQKFVLTPKDAHRAASSSALHALRDVRPLFDQFYNDDFFSSSRDPFEQMRKMRERMMKEFE